MTSRATHPHPILRPSTADRVGKLVRLLASDQPGEVFGAAQALRRVIACDGLDLHDLARVIESAASRPDVSIHDGDCGSRRCGIASATTVAFSTRANVRS